MTPAGFHPAQLDDLRQRRRLLVRDDRERLECLNRQPGRRLWIDELPNPVVELGPGRDLVAAGHLDQLKPPVVPGVGLLKLLQRLTPAVLGNRLTENVADLSRRHGLRRREDEGLDDRAHLLGR